MVQSTRKRLFCWTCASPDDNDADDDDDVTHLPETRTEKVPEYGPENHATPGPR
eukprot:CAMPEP_0177738606 /NCGR_PEP_ID=MMETSP0484_2-20121128/26547_1 /TAXON_ID=354590 /ORGANISM="Rhodomonas lens, Strain RHODO" /LENGTH=53 /DNA_ID=CAMNT_0019252543 /DNA_START=490 /DNA_END=647 /DNA_ORIENTATION=+